MKRPSEIVAEAVRDELYARAHFGELIARPPAELRDALENDPGACTEFMARHILDHYDEHYDTTPPEDAVSFTEAACIAAGDGEAHIRFRAEKDLANAYRSVCRLCDAESAMKRTTHLAARTHAVDVHLGNAHFGWAAWRDARELDRATDHASLALAYFEKAGAADRAHTVRLFQGCTLSWQGEHLRAVSLFQHAVSEALETRSTAQLGDTYLNMGVCYRELGDFGAARGCFARARRYFRKQGRFVQEAKALRCLATVSILLIGEFAVPEMEKAKDAFLSLGRAGEVCRSTIEVMRALLRRDAPADLTAYCAVIEEEARTFGMPGPVCAAIRKLDSAARAGEVTEEALDDVWVALGYANHQATFSQYSPTAN